MLGRIGAGFGAVFLALALLAGPALAAPKFPTLTGRVVDGAGILSPAIEADLTGKLAGLETQTGRQLVVVTVPDLQGYEVEEYGYQLGRTWGIGDAKADSGVLFIVAPTERKVRIEVGYGLEPILTDALSSVILQTAVLPRFKAGDMPGGIVAGTDAIAAQLALPPEEAQARAQAAVKTPSASSHQRGQVPIFLIILIIFFIFSSLGRRGRRSSGLGGVLPGIILGSLLNGGRGGGGGDWGGGGGGGFSGGGGSFGGGGSSGSW